MGLLDDAIREHLELKRRRGADPAEVDRAEREALGPVRRYPEATEEDRFADQAQAEEELDYEFGPEEAYEDDFDEEPDGRAHGAGPHTGSEPYPEDDEPYHAGEERYDTGSESYGFDSEPEWDDEPSATGHVPPAEPIPPVTEHVSPAEPIPPADDRRTHQPAPPASDDPFSPETRQHSSEERGAPSRGPDEGEEGDELLEETPDFLQDTPDHDRLWFEQRPPRDFDFDG